MADLAVLFFLVCRAGIFFGSTVLVAESAQFYKGAVLGWS